MTVLSPQPLIPGQMPQVGLPIHSNPSTAHPNSRHHTALDQGSIAGLGQHLTPALPSRRSLLEERTPPLQSLPKVQPPNTSSSKMSQVLTEGFSSASNPRNIPSSTPTISWTGQIPSSSSTHQETQSSTQAQKLLYDSASTFATSSTPADISKSNPARASDRLNPTSIPPSSLSLSPAQKSSSQTPADISSVSIPLKQANGSVPAKPASVKSSATIIENDPGQGLVSKIYDSAEGNLSHINIYRISRQSSGLRVACRRPIPSHQVLKYHRFQHHRHKAQKLTGPSSLNWCQLPKGGEQLSLSRPRLQLPQLHLIPTLHPPLGLCKRWSPKRK